jgi:hypothetical protein
MQYKAMQGINPYSSFNFNVLIIIFLNLRSCRTNSS